MSWWLAEAADTLLTLVDRAMSVGNAEAPISTAAHRDPRLTMSLVSPSPSRVSLEGVTLHGAQAVSRRKTPCFLAAKLYF